MVVPRLRFQGFCPCYIIKQMLRWILGSWYVLRACWTDTHSGSFVKIAQFAVKNIILFVSGNGFPHFLKSLKSTQALTRLLERIQSYLLIQMKFINVCKIIICMNIQFEYCFWREYKIGNVWYRMNLSLSICIKWMIQPLLQLKLYVI